MAFIEFRLQWDGRINRQDVAAKFDISLNQATHDLVRYKRLAPTNIRYDLSERAYLRSHDFAPRYDITGVAGYLDQLEAASKGTSRDGAFWIGRWPAFEVLPAPTGEIGLDVLRAVVASILANEPIDVLQQTSDELAPTWCTLLPHALVHDGERWCVRAYSSCAGGYETTPLARIGSFRAATAAIGPAQADADWNTMLSLEIGPNPALPAAAREVVARDYGMEDGKSILQVRHALVGSLLRRLGITEIPTEHAKLVLLNPEALGLLGGHA